MKIYHCKNQRKNENGEKWEDWIFGQEGGRVESIIMLLSLYCEIHEIYSSYINQIIKINAFVKGIIFFSYCIQLRSLLLYLGKEAYMTLLKIVFTFILLLENHRRWYLDFLPLLPQLENCHCVHCAEEE